MIGILALLISLVKLQTLTEDEISKIAFANNIKSQLRVDLGLVEFENHFSREYFLFVLIIEDFSPQDKIKLDQL